MSSAEGGKERNLSSFVPEIEFRLPSFLPSLCSFVGACENLSIKRMLPFLGEVFRRDSYPPCQGKRSNLAAEK